MKVLDWIKAKLAGPLPEVEAPDAHVDALERERRDSLALLGIARVGFVRCPFCLQQDAHGVNTMLFDNRTNSMTCSRCHRSGSLDTLRRRLQDYQAYREPVV